MIYNHFYVIQPFLLILCLLISCTLSSSEIEDISDAVFGNKAFGWKLAAISDFNGDKSTDIIVVDQTNSKVGVLMTKTFGFTQNEILQISNLKVIADELKDVSSVIPGDFNKDYNMDVAIISGGKLFVYYCTCGNGTNSRLLNCPIDFIQCASGKFRSNQDESFVQVNDDPILADVTGDWIPDMVIQSVNSMRLFVGVQMTCNKPETPCFMQEVDPSKYFSGLQGTWLPPVASLFAPFDADMTSDILIGDSFFLNDGSKFVFSKKLPPVLGKPDLQVGMPHILAIENSEILDIILPICSASLQSSTHVKLCKDAGLKRSVFSNVTEMTWSDVKISYPSSVTGFAWVQKYSVFPLPTVRVGDFNLDGFMDMIATVALKNKDGAYSQPTVVGFRNYACNSSFRCFEMVDFLRGAYPPNLIPIVATFVDVTPDARLGYLATFFNTTSETTVLKAFKINAAADLAFLKVSISLNPAQDESTASNLPGAVVRIQLKPKSMKIPLLPRSSHMSLGLPYAVIGLGQLPPFVDELSVKMTNTNHSAGLFKHQLIIPNSQLVLIADPPDDPSRWPLKSFLLLNWYMFAVLALLGILGFVSTILLGGLHFRDKRIEKREKEEEAQHFHFDGM